MTRRIDKPEDAIPLILERRIGNLPFETEEVKAFTAAECEQIAEAYLDAYLWERSAMWGTEKEHKEASALLKAWRSKFKQWRNEIDTASNTGKIDK